MSELKKYNFHIGGMHCQACVLLTETELKEDSRISTAKSNLNTNSVEVTGDFGSLNDQEIVSELGKLLSKHTISLEKIQSVDWAGFKTAIPVAVAFILLFVLLQKLGLVNLIGSEKLNYGSIFGLGVIASLSTCMAVVGGLILSVSGIFAKEGDKVRPQVYFHLGRLVSFFILGGVIGALGSLFRIGQTGTFLLSFVIGIVMLILGLNLLEIFNWSKRLQITMPKFFHHSAISLTKLNHSLTPVLIGIITFFLPCGFTQSMQVYTLTTGSFLSGGLTMLAFALGTFPVLALVSFSFLSIKNPKQASVFFKTAGLVVIIFALFNIINSLVSYGLISPVFNFL